MSNELLLIALLAILGSIVWLLTNQQEQCVVLITGESVRIVSCKFTPEFIEYAKALKPANSC
uniref:Movement protein TGBp3 n=1 Tax=Helenium virus S TaxID=12171 RepID=Q86767_HELVS|nr:coat protein [Helenium virus S]QQX32702.1 TGB3 [Helenium virus S]QQX32708.1 TGB3 [Helenium virus S]QQX32725.1 TGB3 [Helenium virus S]QQX32731.1 triple gene block 3 [Helenium virus S]